MSPVCVILASDFSGFFEFLIWWAANGFYLVMLLITAIGCIGRASRTSDDLTRSLVFGGIALLFSLALVGWQLLDRRYPEWQEFRFFAAISASLWSAALLLRWYQRRI